MASPPAPVPRQAVPVLARGITRSWAIPACSLKVADLRRLFEILQSKALEAAAEQVTFAQNSGLQVADQLAVIREKMALTVSIQGASGEWKFGNSADVLSEDSLPAVLTSVVYDCGSLYRSRFNLFAQNQFSVTVDFTRTPLGDLTNLALATGLGPSTVNISGVNSTWINAVDHELRAFFAETATRRGWLYARLSYDLALFFVGVPLSLNVIYHLDKRVTALVKLPPAIFVALYVYLGLVGLVCFRFLFNYTKWVFPKIEGPPTKTGRAGFHKTVIGALGLALLTRVVTTIFWLAGIHLR